MTRPTLELAMDFSIRDSTLCGRLQALKQSAGKRLMERWELIQQKQQQLIQIQAEIDKIQKELSAVSERLKRLVNDEESFKDRLAIEKELSSINWQLIDKRKEWTLMRKAPDPIMFPLSFHDDNKALQQLFFLFMPKRFQILSNLGCSAESLLWPKLLNVPGKRDLSSEYLISNPKLTTWDRFYNEYIVSIAPETQAANVDNQVRSVFLELLPSKGDIGSSLVDQVSSKEDGIWYPDKLGIDLCWDATFQHNQRISGKEYISWDSKFAKLYLKRYANPFAYIPHSIKSLYFTGTFPSGVDTTLQQFLSLADDGRLFSSARGNVGIATQFSKPKWMDKQEYLEFAALRAFPLQQIRKLCRIMYERLLPLNRPEVRTLMEHALFQLGNIQLSKENGEPEYVWKRDLADNLDTMAQVTLHLLKAITNSPKDLQSLLYLRQVCSVLADRNKDKYGDLIRTWR
jgi:hypothetical protein